MSSRDDLRVTVSMPASVAWVLYQHIERDCDQHQFAEDDHMDDEMRALAKRLRERVVTVRRNFDAK